MQYRVGSVAAARGLAMAFVILVISAMQIWAALDVVDADPGEPLYDGVQIINRARSLQSCCPSIAEYIEHGLYPLFLSLFDLNNTAEWNSKDPKLLVVFTAQAILLAASTAFFLSVVLSVSAGPFLKRFATALGLALLLLSPLVVVWPANILNETASISLLLLFLSSCLYTDAHPSSVLALIITFVAGALLVFVRDPLVYFSVLFLALACANAVVSGSSKRGRVFVIIIGAMILALAGIKAYSIKMSGKYVENLANIVQIRILPDDGRRRFFADHGLPISSIVVARSGEHASVDNKLYETDDELAEFPGMIDYRNWLRADGAKINLKFLLTDPSYLVRSLWRTPNLLREDVGDDSRFSIADLFSRPYPGYGKTPYPEWLADFLLAPFGWFISLIYVVAAIANFVANTARMRPASRIDTAAIAASIALFISYHSDAWDPWRHAIPFLIVIYISLVLRTSDAVGCFYSYFVDVGRAPNLHTRCGCSA